MFIDTIDTGEHKWVRSRETRRGNWVRSRGSKVVKGDAASKANHARQHARIDSNDCVYFVEKTAGGGSSEYSLSFDANGCIGSNECA